MRYNHKENIGVLNQQEGIQDAFDYAVNDPYGVVIFTKSSILTITYASRLAVL